MPSTVFESLAEAPGTVLEHVNALKEDTSLLNELAELFGDAAVPLVQATLASLASIAGIDIDFDSPRDLTDSQVSINFKECPSETAPDSVTADTLQDPLYTGSSELKNIDIVFSEELPEEIQEGIAKHVNNPAFLNEQYEIFKEEWGIRCPARPGQPHKLNTEVLIVPGSSPSDFKGVFSVWCENCHARTSQPFGYHHTYRN